MPPSLCLTHHLDLVSESSLPFLVYSIIHHQIAPGNMTLWISITKYSETSLTHKAWFQLAWMRLVPDYSELFWMQEDESRVPSWKLENNRIGPESTLYSISRWYKVCPATWSPKHMNGWFLGWFSLKEEKKTVGEVSDLQFKSINPWGCEVHFFNPQLHVSLLLYESQMYWKP